MMLNLQELRKSALFTGVEVAELRRVLPQLEKKYYSRGAIIFKEGDPSQALYLILSGQVKIIERNQQGRPEVLMYLHAGDFFGETSVITHEIRSVTAEVVIDAEILIIPKAVFEEIYHREPKILHNVIRTLSQRLSLKTKGLVQRNPKTHSIIAIYHPRKEIEGAFLTSNLAASILKQTETSVAVLDLSLKNPNLVKILRLDSDKEIKDEEINQELVEKMLISHPSGLELLALSPEFLREGKIGREKIARILSILKEKFSYTVINTSPEITKGTFEALDLSDKIVLLIPFGEEPPVHMFDQQEVITVYYQTPQHPGAVEEFLTGAPPLIIDWGPEFLEPFHKAGELIVEKASDNPTSEAIHRLARHITGLKLGIALGGVAARGLAHIGVLDVLEQNKIPIDLIAATNTGAIIGAAYASGVRSKNLIEIASQLAYEYELGTLRDFRIFQGGFLSNKKVLKLIASFLGPLKTFGRLKIPLRIITMELETGKDVAFEKGSLWDALQASMAVPGLFPPVKIGGKTFVDGSNINPIPVSHLIEMRADIVVGVNALSPLRRYFSTGSGDMEKSTREEALTEDWKMMDIIMRSFQKLQHEIGLSKATLADLTITPEVTGFSWKDFKRAPEIIDAGRRAAEQALPKLLEIRSKRKLYRRS
ncbi:MAG TPA: patatin-like phospholipase family protein [Candidatus Limnocylindrales bacterium]|nr:patatin-like phospholipase family protein [Candidatus Limnocylindrales bacterium]